MKALQVFQICPLPETGYLRLSQILGSPRRGIPGFIPVSATTWWTWVKAGKAPRPLKLGPAITVWRAEDLRALIADLARQASATTPPTRGQSLARARRRKREADSNPGDEGSESEGA